MRIAQPELRDFSLRRAGTPAKARRGQAAIEFALLYSAVILPLTFMIVFVAEMLWTWHSVVDFTRAGAQFAATHCWESDGSGSNVLNWMQTHVPRMIDQQQFQNNAAGISALLGQKGTAQANGIAGQYGAWQSAINGIGNAAGSYFGAPASTSVGGAGGTAANFLNNMPGLRGW